jgi:lipid-binding SYLF domain-containing protein
MKGLALAASIFIATGIASAETAQERLVAATETFHEIMGTPDKGIPQDLLEKAQCAVIVPGMKKAAFIVGGEFGRGFVVCRNSRGRGWGDPAAIRVEGGSFGFQIGGSSTDVVMLVLNQRGMSKLMSDKVTLGADASVAAGPVGRTADAQTDAQMNAEILSWSRTQGLFAGIALTGATLRPDQDQNAEIYGRKMGTREVVSGDIAMPNAAKPLIADLDRYSMRKEGGSDADRTMEHNRK